MVLYAETSRFVAAGVDIAAELSVVDDAMSEVVEAASYHVS